MQLTNETDLPTNEVQPSMTGPFESSFVKPLAHEPWVHLANGQELANWTSEDEVAYNQASRQTQKLGFYVNAFDFVTALEITGDYFEFGCHRVRTMRMALTEARRHGLDKMGFFAFDSFEGLPESESKTGVPGYFSGALSTSEEAFRQLVEDHGIYASNVHTVKGFYQDSLTETLQSRMLADGSKIAIVCLDCDLYESAVPIFHFIEPFIQEGTVIYIDDYLVGFKGSPRHRTRTSLQGI